MRILLFILGVFMISCNHKDATVSSNVPSNQELQDSIIAEVFRSEVLRNHGMFSTEWQEELNKALAKDSTIAYLWQQKAMPLYKDGKYQLGRPFLDKAAKLKPDQYLEYRGFMKCIFEKNYREAIIDFENCIEKYGDSYVMDHSYSFYMAISKIQLHEFIEAEDLLKKEIERQKKTFGESNVHSLDLFYLGIALYEQNKFEAASKAFKSSLSLYENFADAQYYRSVCLRKLGNETAADSLQKIAIQNGKKGHSFNEDNSIYERYPYQIRWKP